jgi:hypothetical protein
MCYLLGMLEQTFAAIPFSFSAGLLRAPEFGLEFLQGPAFLGQVLFQRRSSFRGTVGAVIRLHTWSRRPTVFVQPRRALRR